MEVEDIAGVGFATGGTTQDERHFAIGHGLLREVVVDYEGVLAAVAEEFANGGTGEGSIVLECSGLTGGGAHDDGVVHGTGFAKRVDDTGYGRCLLADGHVDTVDGVACGVVVLLVDDGVDGDGGLAGLAVANDELTLAAANGDHGVDTLDTRLEGLGYGLAVDYARCLAVEGHEEFFATDGLSAVQGTAEGVDDAAEHLFVHFNRSYFARALDGLAFFDSFGRTHEHYADIVFLEVHGHGHYAVFKFYKLVLCDMGQAVDVGYTITDREHYAYFLKLDIVVDVVELAQENFAYFTGFDIVGHLFLL